MKSLSRAFLILGLIALGCNENSENPENTEYPDLRIYLDRFEEEAKARGYDFDLARVQAIYVDDIKVNGVTYCGYGYNNYDGSGLRRIEISKDCRWATLTDIQRENFIFHEIGHAFLNRGHDETRLCNGTPVSLMTTKADPFSIYTEAGEKRDYYITELVDPLIAYTQCIQSEKNWETDSVYYQITKDDDSWFLYTDNGKYAGTRSQTNESEDYLTLASIPGIDAQVNGYWFKQFSSLNIPECADVKFKVKMNSTSLVGTGAAISVRAYKTTLSKYGASTEQYLRVSTEEDPANGELIDFPQEVVVPCYTRATVYLIIFVVLRDQTQGKVTFNDIEVLVDPG
jgi:hypothetical protein